MQQDNRFDVIIVGAGHVGLTLALALTQSARGIRVAIVDRRRVAVPHDNRASAIAAGVRRSFEALGVWSQMLAESQAITAMRITDSGNGDISRPLFLTFDGEVAPGEPFAHMVPNQTSARALLEGLGAAATVFAPAEVASYSVDSAQARLKLVDGRALTAPLLVAADGARSALRTMAGIDVFASDYEQTGLVTTISHAEPHEGVAYEHFRPAGPFASLPLPGNRSSLVWPETGDAAKRLLGLDRAALALEIEAGMGSTLGAVTVEDDLAGFPLRLQIAKAFIAPRLALVGDAAHVVHPISGQGLNLGLKDVAALAEVVVSAIRLGLDHGGVEVLERYQAWRRLDVASMAAMTDTLNRLFSNDTAPMRALRDFGLGLVDRTGPVKSAMIRTASGLSSSGPRLLNGMSI